MFSYFVLWLCNFLIPFINYIQFCSTSLFWRYIKASEGKSICTMFLTEITWMFLTDKINWTVGFIHNWKLGKLPNLWSEEILRRYSNVLQFELLWIGPHRFAGLNHLTHCNYVIDSIPRGILDQQIYLRLVWTMTEYHLYLYEQPQRVWKWCFGWNWMEIPRIDDLRTLITSNLTTVLDFSVSCFNFICLRLPWNHCVIWKYTL